MALALAYWTVSLSFIMPWLAHCQRQVESRVLPDNVAQTVACWIIDGCAAPFNC
jgi:hypothetical protein